MMLPEFNATSDSFLQWLELTEKDHLSNPAAGAACTGAIVMTDVLGCPVRREILASADWMADALRTTALYMPLPIEVYLMLLTGTKADPTIVDYPQLEVWVVVSVLQLQEHWLGRLPPVAVMTASAFEDRINEQVGLIRNTWLESHTNGQMRSFGPWTHAVTLDLRGSALPDVISLRRGFDFGPNPPCHENLAVDQSKTDYVPELIDETAPSVLRHALMWLKEELENCTYIGPKRATVPRHLSDRSISGNAGWGNGLAAWDWMLRCDDDAFEKCSEWLERLAESNVGRTASGYSIIRERFLELPVDGLSPDAGLADFLQTHKDAAHRRIELEHRATRQRLHPQDVGEGITQVIPVIAALVKASTSSEASESVTAIEQPELHLHPSLAARIGDLAICTMLAGNGCVSLIETHSEHLILRILRRIRQTTDSELPEHIPPVKADDVCVLWVDNLGDGTVMQRLGINQFGDFIDRWPRGFFTERSEELF
jgi:hypothetical protein